MDTFTPTPAPEVSSSSSRTYRIERAQFGDGYEQRIAAAHNPIAITATLVWSVLSHTSANTLQAFFDAQGGWKAFEYTLPWESSPRRWRCEKLNRTERAQRISTITAELVEVHDL